MKKNIIPTNDPNRVLWLNAFALKLANYYIKYGISNDDFNTIQKMAPFFAYWVNLLVLMRDYISKVTTFKNEMANGVDANEENPTQPTLPVFDAPPALVITGIFPFVMSIVKRIKAHKDYAVSDGQDMGIEGEEMEDVNINDLKPALKIVLINGGYPNLQWVKGITDGIAIYVDRGTGTWEFLAIDTVPNYTDTHALPAPGQSAVWKYKTIYRIDDNNVGKWSEDYSITVSGM